VSRCDRNIDARQRSRIGNKMDDLGQLQGQKAGWPLRPTVFAKLLTPLEAAQYLRLDETSNTPESAIRTMNYWRDRGELRATKFARRVWYLKEELEKSLQNKTEKSR
jgi:hypothetical protein